MKVTRNYLGYFTPSRSGKTMSYRVDSTVYVLSTHTFSLLKEGEIESIELSKESKYEQDGETFTILKEDPSSIEEGLKTKLQRIESLSSITEEKLASYEKAKQLLGLEE